MKIASYPPSVPRPSPDDAARHISEEARVVLASLRGGPPHVARGELASGLRELRSFVRRRFFEPGAGGGECRPGTRRNSRPPEASLAAGASTVPCEGEDEDFSGDGGCVDHDGDVRSGDGPHIRASPPPSPGRDEDNSVGGLGRNLRHEGGLPPPLLSAVNSEALAKHSAEAALASESASTPLASPTQVSPPAPTPHSVPPPSSPSHGCDIVPPPPLLSIAPEEVVSEPLEPREEQKEQHQQRRWPQSQDPGPYAAPFLAVIVDPRAAGPHTLVALRALHRLLEQGSILQLSCPTPITATDGKYFFQSGVDGSTAEATHETFLEPVARGVLACRFEQTDAGADEEVEMAIADLLRLLVDLDAAGVRAAEAELLRRVYAAKRSREVQQRSAIVGSASQKRSSASLLSDSHGDCKRQTPTEKRIRIQRLPSSVLMEAFHAVFVTRHTFVRDAGGHHSPALSFHFECVLTRMVHVVFGGEDSQSSLRGKSGAMSSRHAGAAKKILEFLINSLNWEKSTKDLGVKGWNMMMMHAAGDGRALSLRLIQRCLRAGWGGDAVGEASSSEEDLALLRVVEDDLCFSLLTTGQAIWAHHDGVPLPSGASPPPSSSGGGVPTGGGPLGGTSLGLLSEVCATLHCLWGLTKLRASLRGQFEAIFCGFYQRALSLLRRRPLPEDGAAYQANLIFDAEVEVILESLVDVLCLGVGNCNNDYPLSTIETMFLTYDCSMTETDVASGLLVELSRCCGGVVDKEGEPHLLCTVPSSANTTGTLTPRSAEPDPGGAVAPMLVARYRPVPDHLKELCFEALLGILKRLFTDVQLLVRESAQMTKDSLGSPSILSLRVAKDQKRGLHHAARLFNEKPREGLQYLLDAGMLQGDHSKLPKCVAAFLQNGLVVGLDKAAVGQYLGEIGKKGEDAIVWERHEFHKDLLTAFCSSFCYDDMTVLDGLRMFLSTFRLPGEAQMIDRILQAFAESVAVRCVESAGGRLGLFSTDEKRASDAAYLLSFSIIMLNTDLHNENIRTDRKMKLSDFVRNNRNYGKEISDSDLPIEYLEGIYRSIKEDQIRTLGEGADGSMTAERWKGVMRSTSTFFVQTQGQKIIRTGAEARDLKELLLESTWQPILSAVSGLWGMVPWEVYQVDTGSGNHHHQGASLMGARLGIDLAYEMLSGASILGRQDIFQDLFSNVCHMSGLLRCDHDRAAEERAENFLNSIERQSAFIIAISVAVESGDMIGLDGWKSVWELLFELRDFRLLSGQGRSSIMKETDPDLLSPESRTDFVSKMESWDGSVESKNEGNSRKSGGMSLMSLIGFGSSESLNDRSISSRGARHDVSRRLLGKENCLQWDDFASSDEDIEYNCATAGDTEYLSFPLQRSPRRTSSIGATFENQLVYESMLDSEEMGVTGLERMDIGRSSPRSLRSRVRQRLSRLVDFHGLVAESRYLSEEGLSDTLNSLVEIIRDSCKRTEGGSGGDVQRKGEDEESEEYEEVLLVGPALSPASEALAEILLCEIAVKNRDRFSVVWKILCAHYNSRLSICPHRRLQSGANLTDAEWQVGGPSRSKSKCDVGDHQLETIKLTPGVEKCVTGILRLCAWTSNRNMIANQVLSTLKILHPPFGALVWSPLEANLDKHLAEGLWRICRNVDGLAQVDTEGWSGILGLIEWCATRGGVPLKDHSGSLAEDDPSLQSFRSLHLILSSPSGLQVYRWPQIVRSVRSLVEAGERGSCPKLSIAGIDLLQVLHAQIEGESETQHLLNCWYPILEAIREPGEQSKVPTVRQQAISLLTDSLLDRHGSRIPVDSGLCKILNTISIPLASSRITDLLRIPSDVQNDLEEILIELELCVSLLFKPFLHHLRALAEAKQEFVGVWISMLGIMTHLLGDESAQNKENAVAVREGIVTREKLFLATRELGSEHLRNAVMVLGAMGLLMNGSGSKSDTEEFSSITWAAIGSIGYCKPYVDEWKSSVCQ